MVSSYKDTPEPVSIEALIASATLAVALDFGRATDSTSFSFSSCGYIRAPVVDPLLKREQHC